MSKFQGNRIVSRHIMRLAAKPDAVFPLLCPERELEWIDGWNYGMIYSVSGLAEPGCTFKTNLPFEGEAYWIMTKHTPPFEAEYVRFIAGLAIICLAIRLAELDGQTTAEWVFTYTGITAQGNDFVATKAAEQAQYAALVMERSLNHFLNTGEKLQNPI